MNIGAILMQNYEEYEELCSKAEFHSSLTYRKTSGKDDEHALYL